MPLKLIRLQQDANSEHLRSKFLSKCSTLSYKKRNLIFNDKHHIVRPSATVNLHDAAGARTDQCHMPHHVNKHITMDSVVQTTGDSGEELSRCL